MKVILQEDVDKLGKSGDVVNVSGGFARNYLLPRKLAARATTRNVRELEHAKRAVEQRRQKRVKQSAELRLKLHDLSVTIAKPVGENEKLYGSVTLRDVEQALHDEGLVVDRKRIQLPDPIRTLGVYTAHVRLEGGEEAPFKVWVVAK